MIYEEQYLPNFPLETFSYVTIHQNCYLFKQTVKPTIAALLLIVNSPLPMRFLQ